MADPYPGGLPEGTSLTGFIREDGAGDQYVPCGCGQAVQRPDAAALATVDEARRVFVCEREDCDRRTVQRRAAAPATEADR